LSVYLLGAAQGHVVSRDIRPEALPLAQ
jgi:hypothetical protein